MFVFEKKGNTRGAWPILRREAQPEEVRPAWMKGRTEAAGAPELQLIPRSVPQLVPFLTRSFSGWEGSPGLE